MGTWVGWLAWGLVVLGIAFVAVAVVSLSGRLRPLRRALRRLGWRREEVARLQAKAEVTTERVEELTAELERLATRQADAASRIPPRPRG